MERYSFCMVSEVRSKLCKNCAFPQNFHTRKLGGITVFYAVGSLALLEVPLNSFEIFITGHEYFKYHIFDGTPYPIQSIRDVLQNVSMQNTYRFRNFVAHPSGSMRRTAYLTEKADTSSKNLPTTLKIFWIFCYVLSLL